MSLFGRLRQSLHLGGRDWIFFVLALLLSFGIWLIHNLGQEYSGQMTVPVRAVSNLDGHAQESTIPSTVVAVCHTTGYNFLSASLRDGEERVFLEAADLQPGRGDEYTLSGGAMNNYVKQFFGDGVSVEAFITDTLKFLFPKENSKKVPVDVIQELTFRPQYMASTTLKLEPDSVYVYGDDMHIANVSRVSTAPLKVTDIHRDIHGILKIRKIAGVRFSIDEVMYNLPVSRYIEIKTSVPVQMRGLPADKKIKIYPSTAEVTFRCVFPISYDPVGKVGIYVNYEDYAQSRTGRCAPRYDALPQGVIDCTVYPEVFECLEEQ